MCNQSEFEKWWLEYNRQLRREGRSLKWHVQTAGAAWDAGVAHAVESTCDVWTDAMRKALLEQAGRHDDNSGTDRETETG